MGGSLSGSQSKCVGVYLILGTHNKKGLYYYICGFRQALIFQGQW